MRQITVISDDQPGLLAKVTGILASADINIDSLDAETIEGHGVLNLTVDSRYDEALKLLTDQGIRAISEDAIVIRLPDEPGALARISARFRDAGINLRSVRILRRQEGYGLVALSTERTAEALALVEDVRVS